MSDECEHFFLPLWAETHGGELDVRYVYCARCLEEREI